ncbi:AraC family transcriptional regulator [Paenibacillus polysaccharolyticus]|uniref:AraC family transcriptional regulator n=1 Tax=Paenibacillus polysaccharolyticus TaxID=582692 RepID=UPI00203E633A|nr:AraC family transcriptional regulator [Paenibacillus polysaccharolyticus]MCM3132687.1 AraC family transcriptional regulator [Paenibacillus polysaccharolyticus]
MNLYGAQHHILVHSNAIDAEVHQHTFIQVTIALESDFEIEVQGEVLRTAGIMLNSNVSHRLQGSGQSLVLLLIDSTSSVAAAFKQYMGKQAYANLPPVNCKEVAEFIKASLPQIHDAERYGLFLQELMTLFQLDYTPPAITDSRIKELIRRMKDCTDSEHSIRMYAEQFDLSNSRLSHLFKENTGISLSGYMLLHKLQKACYLIFQGTSITDAAMAAGFDTPSHFANTSKRLLGMTAKDIRKDSVFLQVSSLH